MKKKLNIGVLVSGSGSNLQSIIDHIEKGLLDAEIKVVISNNPDAYALERAKKHQLKMVIIDHRSFDSREAFEQAMVDVLKENVVRLVIMAGFMRLLSSVFLRAFPMRIMNIHPAVLPSFPGIHAQDKALRYGVKFTGCTVHFADENADSGPIIIQSIVPIYDDDTEETLAARILREEHKIYPQAIQYYAEGKIEIHGRKVRIINSSRIKEIALHNPPLTIHE
jgi:phosphoribosylglycinamide formyltransferase-1